ncbi:MULTISPECIES: sensor domain-containing diguanylate cyclase [Psychrilyobacter]|uniref:Diguanylate cyclase n=1 Tax=Psychrilyobacter piezotolerans TaxID=2293438 RepID=A0ABX9KIH8_9FUSO|nr:MULTISPECIES: diguanylate cyclase [Psychrilyobacter]MCS5420243.1 diguanylate cyclase [Psychrilyobacter sp. S5]NDI77268.1 diguanylate cyclase [Psychrilyobacter piezotolerans]RDE63323.1 diguanylate cyclase [Psychrilyobacter sp. S5]REI41865.1 diguanylate cyclase [Psychrilyobacter piezotolerans]
MLRIKSLTVVTVSSVLVFIFMFVYLKKSIDTDYKSLEIIRSESVYHLVDKEFQGIYKDLKKINTDWSKWDDTYEFIEGDVKEREKFIKSNLDYGIFNGLLSDLNLNFIIFQDDQGQILYQQGYDELSEDKIPKNKIELITKEISDYKGKTGMLVGENKEVIVFSNLKITDSQEVKKSNGNLIMGYFLNKNRVMALEEKLGIQLVMAGISEKLEIPYQINIGKNKIDNKLYISTLSRESVIFDNQRNADLLILGKKNVKKYMIVLFINFLILISAIYIFMEHIIVKRLRKMDKSVREIIECQDLGKRLKINGRDEIGNLGKNINNLLEDIEIMKEKLYSLAAYDVMTGILNRHTGLGKLEKNFKKAQDNNEIFTIAFVDINDLKYVNDRYSHEEGDKLIKNVVKIIEEKLEPEDVFLRFGGDEFILGFDRLNLIEVNLLFNEIEENIEKFNKKSKKEYTHSISVGIVECCGNKTLQEYVNIADINMYENKRYKKKFPEKIYV